MILLCATLPPATSLPHPRAVLIKLCFVYVDETTTTCVYMGEKITTCVCMWGWRPRLYSDEARRPSILQSEIVWATWSFPNHFWFRVVAFDFNDFQLKLIFNSIGAEMKPVAHATDKFKLISLVPR